MNAVFLAFERASLFGLAALVVALVAQRMLDGRVPASWRVWVWRVALLQTAFALVPLAPLRLAVLSPPKPVAAPLPSPMAAPRAVSQGRPEAVAPLDLGSHSHSVFSPVQSAPPVSDAADSVVEAPRQSSEPSLEAPDLVRPTRPLPLRLVVARPFPFPLVAAALYALGFAVQLVALARSFGRVRRLLRACTPVTQAAAAFQLRVFAGRMNVARVPRLLASEGGAPFLTGVLRPTIVLPRALLEVPSQLEPVLAHELAHHKRCDLAWNAPLWLVETLFWFHPLVWIARRFLALETESACDEAVLQLTRVAPKSYGALLLNTMQLESTPLTAGIADGFFALQTRLARLNQTPKRPRRVFKIAFVAALCGVGATSIPLRLVARAQNGAPVARPRPFASTAASGTGYFKTTSGTVVGPDGKAIAGATVLYRMAGASDDSRLHPLKADASGRFVLPPRASARPVQLFAEAGELSTAHSLIAVSGQDVKLPLQANAWAQVGGRVTDENDKTVAGARVHLSTSLLETREATTDAAGRFEFDRVRPGATVYFTAQRVGYVHSQRTAPFSPLQPGKRVSTELVMESAPQTLRGQVLRENGQPASGFQVTASGANDEVLTDKDGRFFLPQVLAGTLSVDVSPPGRMLVLEGNEFSARGGDQNAVFRLSRANNSRALMFGRMATAQNAVAVQQRIDALERQLKQAQAKRTSPGSRSARLSKRQVAELQSELDALQAKSEKVSPAPRAQSASERAYAKKFVSEPSATAWVRAMSWRWGERNIRPNHSSVAPHPSGFVGRKASQLRVIRWLDVKKAPFGSFAGRVTLMAFESFEYRRDLELDDIARSFAGRIQFVGIQRNSRWTTPTMEDAVLWREVARAAPFPIALDALPPGRSPSDGLTAKAFGGADYIVIGRDGRIVYAGDELDWAITFAASASK